MNCLVLMSSNLALPLANWTSVGTGIDYQKFTITMGDATHNNVFVARMTVAAPLAHLSAGETTVGQLMALVARCRALLTNDSGPMHVAVGLGVPVLALFGPTVTDFGFAPLGPRDRVIERAGLRCRPCTLHGTERCPIVTHECLEAIKPEPVAAALLGLLAPARGGKR